VTGLPCSAPFRFVATLLGKKVRYVVSDGEQRTDMINYFNSLPGLGTKPTGPYVKSKIMQFEKPEAFSRQQDVKIVNEVLSGVPASVYDEGKLVVHACGSLKQASV